MQAYLCVLVLGLLCMPTRAAADMVPAGGGCDCSQAPGDTDHEPAGAANARKRRLGMALFAGLTAGAFLYSARRVRQKNRQRP